MSHISAVQTPVKAAGKKRRTVFFLPSVSLSLTSTRPSAFLLFREKSGALDPTERGMAMRRARVAEGRRAHLNGARGLFQSPNRHAYRLVERHSSADAH